MKTLSLKSIIAFMLTFPVIGYAETLTEIYEQSLQNDPQLRAQHAAYMAGKENKIIGRAGLLPQVGFNADYSEESANVNNTSLVSFLNINSITNGDQDTDRRTYTVSVDQPVFNMPAWFDYQQGKTVSEQARIQFQADQQDLIIRVAQAYFGVLKASENLITAIAEERAFARQLEQTQQRYEVGLLPITDVLEAKSAYDNSKVNTLLLRGNLKNAFEALEVLTGREHHELAALASEFPATPPDASREEWVKVALDNNLQLKVAELSRDAARQNAKARKYERLPQVTASYSYQDLDVDGHFSGVSGTGSNPPPVPHSTSSTNNEVSTVGISLSVPIYTGGLVSAQSRQAQQQSVQAEENSVFVMRSTTQQARTAHHDMVTNAATVEARKQAIASAESALEATRAGYDVGTRNIVDVLIAERNLYEATRNYANARYDYIASSLRLKLVAGQLSPDDVYQLNAWLDTGKLISQPTGP